MLGDFFDDLDHRGLDYAVVLTADHGGNDIPERARLAGVARRGAGRSGAVGGDDGQGDRRARLGLRVRCWSARSNFGDLYVDAALGPEDRQRALAAALAAYRAHPQVAAVFTQAQLRAAALPSGPPDRWA